MSVELLRDMSLGINFVEIVLEFEIFLYFLMGYRRVKQEGGVGDKFTLMTAVGFLSGAIARGFYMTLDYYLMTDIYRYLAWIFIFLCLLLVLVALFGGTGRLAFKDFAHKKVYLAICIAFAVAVPIVRLSVPDLLFWIFVVAIGIVLMTPLILQFTKWVNRAGGYIKKYFRIAACGIPLLFVGMAIGPLWTMLPLEQGWIFKISGHAIFLTGLCVLAIALWSMPTLTEFGWQEKIHHLYVLMPGGLLAYEYSFKAEKKVDSDLISGGLSGIVDLVKEMTGSVQRMKIIRQEKKNIYLEYGKKVTIAILAEEELKVLFEKIARFTREFEELFAGVLDNWKGDTKDFSVVSESLVKKYFLPTN